MREKLGKKLIVKEIGVITFLVKEILGIAPNRPIKLQDVGLA
jgi:hypothetical protein